MRKLVTVAWHKICAPVVEGGLGLKSIRSLNEASLLKLSFELLASNKEWAGFLRQMFSFINKPCINYIKPSIWPGIKLNLLTVMENSIWQIGDGKNINFWLDNWLSSPLADQLQILEHMQKLLKCSVSDFIDVDKWIIPSSLLEHYPHLNNEIAQVIIPKSAASDKLCWIGNSSGILSFKDAMNVFRPVQSQVFSSWSKSLWNPVIPSSKSFIAWRLLHKKMATANW